MECSNDVTSELHAPPLAEIDQTKSVATRGTGYAGGGETRQNKRLKRDAVALQQSRRLGLITPADERQHRRELGEVERPRQELRGAGRRCLRREAVRDSRLPNLLSTP